MIYELFHACQSNNIKKITEILDRGIDINCVDFDTGTLSNASAPLRDVLCTTALTGRFIDIINDRSPTLGSTPLHWACAKSQQHAIRLLVERGANINAQNKRGVTPLHSLILNRIEPLAFWLIRRGTYPCVSPRVSRARPRLELTVPLNSRPYPSIR
jgi:ankyrin repeat protein